MTDQRDDDALRARLRAADPAASLPPAAPDRVTSLLESTMSDEHTEESRTDGARDRSRLTWLVAAAAAVLIVGGVVAAVAIGGDDDTPVVGANGTSAPPVPSDEGSESVTELEVAQQPATTRCVSPEVGLPILADQDVAFDGLAVSVSGGVVTLEPTRFYAGEETDLVTVRAPGRDLERLLGAVRFVEGERYLVSATGGRVTLCGFTDVYSEGLSDLYTRAFGG